jgi:serine/threonine protein phosphatase PrpC
MRANENVHKTNQDLVKSGRPMGTTLLAAVVTAKKAYIANVGDSRCYLFRDGDLLCRTEDHSWVDEQVKAGLMSKAEAESDSRKYILTRSVGTHPQVEIDDYLWDIQAGDMLLLCTDGLVNMVKDAEITEEFQRSASPAEIAHRLINTANDNGGKDNITVIVADIMPSFWTVAGRRLKAFSKKRGAKLLYTLLLLVFGGLCFLVGYLVGGGLFAQ